jgi:hypothetical protein
MTALFDSDLVWPGDVEATHDEATDDEAFTDDEATDDELTDDEATDDEAFTDDELAELALAADPEMPLDDDAVPLPVYLGQLPLMLPQWYMPPAIVGAGTRWRTALVIAIVLALVMIDAWGLCSTYGNVVVA